MAVRCISLGETTTVMRNDGKLPSLVHQLYYSNRKFGRDYNAHTVRRSYVSVGNQLYGEYAPDGARQFFNMHKSTQNIPEVRKKAADQKKTQIGWDVTCQFFSMQKSTQTYKK